MQRFFLDQSGPDSAPSLTYKPNANTLLSNIMLQLSTTKANEVDGKLSDALRNFLFGRDMGEDLAGRNIFRGRELGIPTYGGLAKCYGLEPDPVVRPRHLAPYLRPQAFALESIGCTCWRCKSCSVI